MDSSNRTGKINAGIEYEICVSCGVETDIPIDTHIDHRYGYIEGFGQVCGRCNYTEKRDMGMMEFS